MTVPVGRHTRLHEIYKKSNPQDTDTARASRVPALSREGMDGKTRAALTCKGLSRQNISNATKMGTLRPTAPPPPWSQTDDLVLPSEIDTDAVFKTLKMSQQASHLAPEASASSTSTML